MKKCAHIVSSVVILLFVISGLVFPQGHDAPSGPHYNLNIIGVSKGKTADMKGNLGHRIFVDLDGKSKIWLNEGDPFQVLDANGTDNDGAKFQLPDPDPDDNLVLSYSVYARALGKPGGKTTMRTCFVDQNGDEYCSLESVIKIRSQGPSKFTNVSKELLTIYIDLDGNGIPERHGIFDEELWDYFWEYNNEGLKLLQLRFYPLEFDAN